MDKLTAGEVANKQIANHGFQTKYDARYQRGDIVAVYNNGAFKGKPSPNHYGAFIKVPGLKEDKLLQKPLRSGILNTDGVLPLLKKRRYRFNVSLLPAIKLTELNKERVVTLNNADFDIILEDKTS